MNAKWVPKRISAALLCLVLLTSLLPAGALAADDPLGQRVPDESVCICTELCTAEAMNQKCPVCGAEGATPEGCALYEEPAPDAEQPAPARETAVTGFAPLAADVAAQTVPTGGQPVLPDSLSAYQAGEDAEPVPVELADVTWAAEPEYDPNAPGGYTFTAVLPEGYALADGVAPPTITVTVEAQEPLPPANDGISLLASNILYIDDKGNTQTRDSATVVTESDTTWGANDNAEHWYVVTADAPIIIGQRVTVTGNVHLILADECSLTVNGGINVSEGNSLTIYGQSGGTGTLNTNAANSNGRAGIGGIYNESEGGTITINGGTVYATGGGGTGSVGGAGIGGGSGGAGGTITINGGTVTATGGTGAAGIGGGKNGAGGTIIISGGHVIANGSQGSQMYFCAGIGGGFQGAGGSITINGGVVNAHGGWTGIGSGEQASAESTCEVKVNGGIVTATGDNDAGIGGTFSTSENGSAVIIADGKDDNEISDDDDTASWSGVIFQGTTGQVYGTSVTPAEDFTIPEDYTLTIESGKTLTISEGVTLTNNGTITVESGGTLINNGTIVNNGTINGSGKVVVSTYYVDTGNQRVEAQAIPVTTGSTTWGAADGEEHWYVVNSDVTFDQERVTVTGNVHLILADGYTLDASLGIHVSEGNSLTIYGQSGGNGAVLATGSKNGAGIGGGQSETGGTIIINGGNVKATGDNYAAGIGGGSGRSGSSDGAGGTIVINGGTVTATGGYWAAGIGGGCGSSPDYSAGSGGNITINGGNVNATGSSYAAGIGGGSNGSGGTITITGGTVTAIGGGDGAGIGGGYRGDGGAITIDGGTVTATGGGDGAGIGNGPYASGGTFSTGDDGHAVIIASSISDNGETTDWSGLIITKTQGEGKIYGNNDAFTISSNLEIPEDYTLTIESGKTLTISEGVTLTNNGTIICYGTINGTVGGDVRYPSAVAVAISGEGVSNNTAPYGSTILITATMQRARSNGISAIANAGTVDFYLGSVESGEKLNKEGISVVESSGTYTATLTLILDGTNWTPSDTPYTITADFGGAAGTSGDGLQSSTGSAVLTVTKASQTAPGKGEGYTINYQTETISAQADYELAKTDSAASGFSSLTATPGGTIYVRLAETSTHNPSPWTAVTIPARPDAPNVQGVNETVAGRNDGRITGLTAGTLYEISSDNGLHWADAVLTGTEITGLAPGTYQVRVKSTADSFAGAAAAVTIAVGDAPTYTLNVTAPAFESVYTGYTQPEAKAITITSSGNSDAAISGVTVDNASFTIGGSGSTVPAGESITTWTIRPAAGLADGTYTATITVAYDGGATATAQVSFTVMQRPSSEPSYSPVLDITGNGDVKVSPRTPSEDDEVTITANPDSGYEVGSVTVTDRSGRTIRVTENRDGTYTFTQPAGRVTIEVTFVRTGESTFFTDVPETFWAVDAISWAYENGYVNGTSATTFNPNGAISRQQVWMILARLSGQDPAGMAAARAWAMEYGVSDGTNPGGAVTRQQLAALLYRFAESQGHDMTARADLSAYPDAGNLSDYAVEPLQWAVAEGIVSGTTAGALNPAGTATRAQFTVMLYRFWTNES